MALIDDIKDMFDPNTESSPPWGNDYTPTRDQYFVCRGEKVKVSFEEGDPVVTDVTEESQ